MPNKIPLAPSMDISSKGEFIACVAATEALSFPLALPMPITEAPASLIIAFTSAKSTFTIPGEIISSVIPKTAFFKTSSIASNAFIKEVSLFIIEKILSLGIAIKVSTFSLTLAIPSWAICALFEPSKPNGFVTTAIVKIPSSLAISATIGVAPVPVPPPNPAAIKTISAPFNASAISALSSSAACWPISGFIPVPNPLVRFLPI